MELIRGAADPEKALFSRYARKRRGDQDGRLYPEMVKDRWPSRRQPCDLSTAHVVKYSTASLFCTSVFLRPHTTQRLSYTAYMLGSSIVVVVPKSGISKVTFLKFQRTSGSELPSSKPVHSAIFSDSASQLLSDGIAHIILF
jgi:hypothetical protein